MLDYRRVTGVITCYDPTSWESIHPMYFAGIFSPPCCDVEKLDYPKVNMNMLGPQGLQHLGRHQNDSEGPAVTFVDGVRGPSRAFRLAAHNHS